MIAEEITAEFLSSNGLSTRCGIVKSSSVKWGHLGHLESNSIKQFLDQILWGHLGHFEPDPVTTITKNQK